MHMDAMKRARVSSVYEGKERTRSNTGEELARRFRSKHARMTAKARMNVHKESMKPQPKHKKSMVIMKSMRKYDQETQEYDSEPVLATRVVEKEREEEEEAKAAVESTEKKTEMPFSGWVEEWPDMLTYEEEWTWLAFAFGWESWFRYDKVMNGESWFL